MVKFDPYAQNGLKQVEQAADLAVLVNGEKSWLQEARPGTIDRYPTAFIAARSIRRIAVHHKNVILANIVRKDKAAIGIATLIFNQQLVHPIHGAYTGTDIDYWLREGEDNETHQEVARRLLDTNGLRPAIATVREGLPNPARGFAGYMLAIGDPAPLSTGGRPDPMDVAWNGHRSQLYYHLPVPFLT